MIHSHSALLLRRRRGSYTDKQFVALMIIRLVAVLIMLGILIYGAWSRDSFNRDCGDGFDTVKFDSPQCQRWYK